MVSPLGARLGVPHADRLLDADELSRLLGQTVSLRHVRVKPGRSLLVAWTRSAGQGDDGDHGWALSSSDPDKIAGLMRRADRATGAIRRHDGGLYSGDISTDPRLARSVRHATAGRPVHGIGSVVRYNPGRRLILSAEGATGPVMLRIAAVSLDPLIAVGRRWWDAGVPTLPHRPWNTHPTAAAADRWGRGDLADVPSVDAARAAGEAIAHLHSLPLDVAFDPGARAAAARAGLPGVAAIALVLPHLASEMSRMRTKLSAALPRTSTVPCHGDLSPDQVLLDRNEIRIIDLDRTGVGHPGLDLGTWLAWCQVNGRPELGDAFLAGYRSVAPVPALRPWVARALLACAIDPFRLGRSDWPAEVEARVIAASAELARSPKELP